MNKKVWVVDINTGEYSDRGIEKTVVFEDQYDAQRFAKEWDDKAVQFEAALSKFKDSAEYKKRDGEHAAIIKDVNVSGTWDNRTPAYREADKNWYDWKAEQINKIIKEHGLEGITDLEYMPISTDVREADFVVSGEKAP